MNFRIDDQFVIKVGDFGLTEKIYTKNYFRQDIGGQNSSVRLPVKWMALESLLDRIFSEKTDVVSMISVYSVNGWMLFSHYPPWEAEIITLRDYASATAIGLTILEN